MNPDTLFELVHKGFRVTLGATTSLVESLQDSQKREQNLAKLQSNPNQLVEDLAEKGAATEQEARNFVDTLLSQMGNQVGTSPSSGPTPTPSAAASPTVPPEVQTELRELIQQIAAIRTDLEKLRNQEPSA